MLSSDAANTVVSHFVRQDLDGNHWTPYAAGLR